MRHILLASLVCCGCSEEIWIDLGHFDNEFNRGVAEDAAEILGYPVTFSQYDNGALNISVIPEFATDVFGRRWHTLGESSVHEGCARAGWSVADAHAMAHEMGHMLGLNNREHHEDPRNLMTAERHTTGTDLEDWQLERIDDELAELRWCRDFR